MTGVHRRSTRCYAWPMQVAVPLLLLAAVLAFGLMRFWPRGRGTTLAHWETRVGVSTLLLAVCAVLAAGWTASAANALPPVWRLALVVALLTVAVVAASDQWTRVPLRLLGGIGLAIVLGLLVRTGQAATARTTADQAMAELAAVAASVDALAPSAAERVTELDKHRADAVAKATADLRAVAADQPELAASAEAVLARLADRTTQPEDLAEDLAAAMADFDAQHPAASLTASARALRTDLQTAVDAAVAASRPVTDASVRAAVTQACRTARARSEESLPACEGAANGEALPVQMAVVRLRLAQYRSDLLARAEDASAVTEAEAALTAARAATTTSSSPLSLVAAVEAGANEILDDVFDGEPPVELGWLVWLLIGASTLVAWRQVERRSARQEAGPVRPTFTAASSPDDNPAADSAAAGREQLFRTALLVNLSEPAAVPGATRTTPFSDLVELAAGSAGWLKNLVDALRAVVSEPHGYVVDAREIPRVATGGQECRVLVRICDNDTGGQVAVRTVTGEDAAHAARGAGYWAAATVLRRSTRIPSWAAWSGQSYEALAGWEEIGDRDVDALRRAVAHAPTSGLLLHKLADAVDLSGRHAEALGLCARAVAVHPGYMIARYRMAVSVGMLCVEPDKHWLSQPLSIRLRTASEVGRACAAIGCDAPDPHLLADQVGARAGLVELAEALYTRLIEDLGRRQGLGRLWRRSERGRLSASIPDVLNPFGAWAQLQWIAKSALTVVRPSPQLVQEVEACAMDPRSWWQLSYNLACLYARGRGETGPDVPRAINWLETALDRPGSGQMGGPWLRVDPDLDRLRGHPRFEALLATLNPDPQEAST